MYATVKKVNSWIKSATKAEVDTALSRIILSDRQIQIFEKFYIKGYNVDFIADSLNVCSVVINKELKYIRNKLDRVI